MDDFRDCGHIQFNLHKSESQLKMTSIPKRGRPKRNLLDTTRASFWALNLSYLAQKKPSEIEREIFPNKIKRRDGGGYIQPHDFNKYANGTRVPTPPTKGIKSPVNLAEARYPSSADAYNSIVWDILNEPEMEIDIKKYYSSIPLRFKIQLRLSGIDICNSKELFLSDDNFIRLVKIRNIETLGLMLVNIKCLKDTINPLHIYLLRSWLSIASIKYMPLKNCYLKLFLLVEDRIQEAGILTSPDGLAKNISDESAFEDAWFAAILSGKTVTTLFDTNISELFS